MSARVPDSLLTTSELLAIASFRRTRADNLDAALSEFDDTVVGPGTTNRIAKFTGATTVDDSSVSDDGTTVTVNADFQVTGDITIQADAVSIVTGTTPADYTKIRSTIVAGTSADLNMSANRSATVRGAIYAYTADGTTSAGISATADDDVTYALVDVGIYAGVKTITIDAADGNVAIEGNVSLGAEHLTGDNDAPIAMDLTKGTSFLSTSSAELGQEYTLNDGVIDGQVHHVIAVHSAAGDVYFDVTNLYAGTGNNRFILAAANSDDTASMSLVWNETTGFWHVLGTPIGFTGPT